MKLSFLFVILFFCLSCSEDSKNTVNSGGGNTTSIYRIEIEPTLSYDRSTLLMVRADTGRTDYNGIYSASSSHPVRVLELLGANYKSPTLAVDKRLIAFLHNDSLYFYDKSIDSVYLVSTSHQYGNIFFMNDLTLIGQSGSTLYLIDLISNSTIAIGTGIFPTAYHNDTLAYLTGIGGNLYTINIEFPVVYRMKSTGSSTVLDTIADSPPRGFGIEPYGKRFCYTISNDSGYTIKAGKVGIDSVWTVATSKYPDVIILDYQTIIFTGEDGRLYRTNFLGTSVFPYWEALDS